MSPTMLEISAAILILAVSIALIVWIRRRMRTASERRMMRMLKRAGLDPKIVTHPDIETAFKEVRRRCRKCQVERFCERWLAGEKKGGPGFCPNAHVFAYLGLRRNLEVHRLASQMRVSR